ncbi:2-amino-4-oxopentanoate thiolase subunit OrtA [Terrisporobacter hibernicus]|uniref:2-amino-4-oxopentanoate thiolase subunit OrtA n=1 Tax=Terrisporobacter hibernicus TaxID=2813371 RepID=UPI002102BB56|nr:2-amino-4-oxopentanoate thiolase subunit OrtA [Terrisporobacter hibernicus]
MIIAKKGDWVEIQEVLLKPEERAPQVPDDTKEVPLVQWIRGLMITDEATIGDQIEIETIIGRSVRGQLCAINPRHVHDFGEPVKELIQVGMELRREIEELNNK